MRVLALAAVLLGSLVSVATAEALALEVRLGAVEASVELPEVSEPAVPEARVPSPSPPSAGSLGAEAAPDPVARPHPSPAAAAPSGPETQPSEPGSRPVERIVRSVPPAAGAVAQAPPRAGAVAPEQGASADRVVGASPPIRSSGPGARSVRPAVAAPLRELLAYVWPAIALGPVGSILLPQLALLERRLPPAGVGARALLPPLPGGGPAGPAPGPSVPSAVADPSDAAPFYASHEGGMSLLVAVITVLAALIGLVALARLAVGEDFFSMRWLR